MNRLVIWTVRGALLAASAGLMIANAQQSSAPVLIAGDQPVTAEQVREKLQSDGWSNVVVSRSGRYIGSDRIPEWAGRQNGCRLANGSPSSR
jgi:CTP:molybdopterin cytidylyltransferase MocA